MVCSINTHHTTNSWFLVLVLALLARRSNALWTNNTRPDGSGTGAVGSSLQVPACCRPEHAAALLQLKRHIILTASSNCCLFDWDDNTTLSSWIEGTDCCRWEGVACDDDRVAGSVTSLNLSSLCISGGIHRALFSLTSLEHLNLDGNDFCGSHLPASGFERLTRLEDLSLANCNLSGPVPPSFAGLHSLQSIDLSSNNFSGSTFPVWITNLKQLEVLDFHDMGLSGTIPSSIGNLSLLTELCLSGNSLSGGLPSSLSNLAYLSRLECSGSGLSGLVPSLTNLSRLEFIDLSSNNLEGPIPLSDGNILPNLQEVDLGYNSFTGIIQASIFTYPKLQLLDLSSNNLSDHIEEFKNPSVTLAYISLSKNKLTGAIPTSFSQLRALNSLNLDTNNFTGTLDLYPYLMLRNLYSFSASYNPLLSVSADDRDYSTYRSSITDLYFAFCGLTRVPSVIRHLPYLDFLDLSNNRIRGNIPHWIWKNMSFLSLQHNLLTEVEELPAYTTIGDIDLSFNKLGGPVPFPFIAGALDYSNNKFSSIPPLGFHQLFQVGVSINLANNKLSGPIPYVVFHGRLQVLDLSGNNLSGPVAPYLQNGCVNQGLAVLNLRGNRLSGTWPDEIGESCSLVVIDLNGNQIQGRLPRSLASCKSLRHFDVAGNKFVDVFPSWLGSLPNLWLLVLRSNQFYGPLSIPVGKNHSVATGYFSSLQIIDLAGNGFNGVLRWELFDVFNSMVRPQNNSYLWGYPENEYFYDIESSGPHSVPIEVAMKQQYLRVIKVPNDLVVIDLSSNRFSGSIPKTIGNLTALLVLNLSHNALSGSIPAEFGRLSNVESLDLSWNHLTGSIPQALASLTNLEVLNLSYNHLRGRIPSGRQFSTFTSSSFQGGNQGLYGCPLPVRCNLTRPPSGASTPPPPPQDGALATAEHSSEAVILWLFVGSGYGIGIAVAVVLEMTCYGRRVKSKAFKS